ncbi:MAG: PD40 domain-containing protein [Anaerolineae bacterium]|nr:PD40 domain-containing protein [Anaerolineae bacterium]
MTRKWLLLLVLMVVSVVSVVWAQGSEQSLFVPLQQIGERRPQGIRYDPVFDRLALVDLQGRLVLVDAASFQTQHILYDRGAYNAYTFSHDGRYLALALDRRVEIWDTQTGQLSAMFEPDGATLVQGPLLFSPDDTWLLLDTVVPAPQETRRSENDTEIIPWLWDLTAARNEAPERLRGGAEAFPFFNYRNGLVMWGNLFLIAGQPNRLQVIDARTNDFTVIADIPANRAEQDPLYAWRSINSDLLYVDPRTSGIVQVDAQTGALFEVPLGRDLNFRNLETMQNLRLGESARVLCEPNSLRETPLLSLLYGDDYMSYRSYQPSTFMLIDILTPLSTGVDQPGLLLYNFVEAFGRGSLELIYPQDVQQMRLSPDGSRLMVRRASGLQPVEIYDPNTCGLEQTLYPAELDDTGTRLFNYGADGRVILVDFQRFDARTGQQIALEDQYTEPFEDYRFSDDGQQLYTFRGSELRIWDVATGQLLGRSTFELNGDVLRRSPDGTRFLIQNQDNSMVFEQIDLLGGVRRRMEVPVGALGIPRQIYPSPNWQRILFVYEPLIPSDAESLYEIAVYDFDLGQILYVAGADMPPYAFGFDWVDNERIFVAGINYDFFDRPYGLDYHPSGLPACLVNAFPDDYSAWLPVWEGLTLRLGSASLNALTERVCDTLPAAAADFIPALTPTPRFGYRSDPTPIPFVIPGVPLCLTQNFARQAVDYAALWRSITADLDAAQIAQLEEMICEGLISSPFAVAATPTIDPNLNVAATPTPADNVPQTTDVTLTDDTLYYTIDVLTGNRFAGTYSPEQVRTILPDVNLLYNYYVDQFNEPPTNPVISPDGTRLAVTDRNGFVTIYRMTRSYADLLQDVANAEATRQAEAPRSIGLAATATQPFSYIGEVRPTLTPTTTPTAPPLAQATPSAATFGQTTDVCPARTLYTLDAPPPDFAVTGRLLAAPPPAGFYSTWVLEPETGSFVANDSLPRCQIDANCIFNPDQTWVVIQGESVVVSRPDGSQATTLFRPEEQPYFPISLQWVTNTLLEYDYLGYLNDALVAQIVAAQGEDALRQYDAGQYVLTRTFDVSSGQRSEPFIRFDLNISIEGLPTSVVSRQPGNGPLLLVTTPYPPFGQKYYIYDLRTNEYDYFARVDNGGMEAIWHPAGRYLYYRVPTPFSYFVYDAQTGEHHVLGSLPAGTWSRDGRYSASWYSAPRDEFQARIAARELPFKLQIWDSETGTFRRYCIPQSGVNENTGSDFYWSPDGRYIAFTLTLPPEGDVFPIPTPEVGIITPSATVGATLAPQVPMGTPTPTAPGAEVATLAPDGAESTPDPFAQPAAQDAAFTFPTGTPIPLEAQYQYRNPRTLILDTQTGAITIVSTEVQTLLLWTDDGGAR